MAKFLMLGKYSVDGVKGIATLSDYQRRMQADAADL